jgi:predicted nucleic acid-binding Zn ribbon protein
VSAKPSRVSDVLAEVFKRSGMKRGIRRAEAVLLWPQVAGEVARFTSARSLQGGTLFVEVADSETAMHLTLQRQRFLDVYKAKFGMEVREIRFRTGRPPAPPPPAAPPSAPAEPKALAKAARDLSHLDLPEPLARSAMKAAKAMLEARARRLAAGWRPCLLCGALSSEGKLCDTCARYAQSPKVRRASQRLAAQPDLATPLLSDEEREVAIYLAKDDLHWKLQELLPQVLAEPTLKPYLTSVARCYLAHTLAKPLADVNDADFDRLDARVARVLGRWG